MILPAAIVLFILFAGSYFAARQLAIRKNRQPNPIILIGLLIGTVACVVILLVSLVYGGLYARLAAFGVFTVMPLVAAAVVPARK